MEYIPQSNGAAKAAELPAILLVNRAVVFDDDRLLLLQRSRDDSYNPGLWEFPGGKVDAGEELVEGLKREVFEETGLEIELSSTSTHVESELIQGGKYSGRLYVALFHSARRLSGELSISNEHEAYTWLDTNSALERTLTPESQRAILAIKNSQ